VAAEVAAEEEEEEKEEEEDEGGEKEDSRVFAPHKQGLQYIVVQGFTIEHAANQWIANFWFPENFHYAQSGALGTRSGYRYRWAIRNNTIRKAKTIGFDWGVEGGYTGHPVDNEGTTQSDPAAHGEHTVMHNTFERNGVSGAQGYGASGTFAYNLVQDNGGLGCGGAEDAAFKSHSYNGTFEGRMPSAGTAPVCPSGSMAKMARSELDGIR
jgi:hypothetical protein